VTLWLVALHLYVKEEFEKQILKVLRDAKKKRKDDPGTQPKHFVLPTKDFSFVMDWARNWIEDENLKHWEELVLSPLRCKNILECTIEVESAEIALSIEQAIYMKFPVISHETCWYSENTEDGKYHKFILLLESKSWYIKLLVEVSIYLVEYGEDVVARDRFELLRTASSVELGTGTQRTGAAEALLRKSSTQNFGRK